MPPRKNQPKKATAKAKPAPAKPTVKTEPEPAPAVVAPSAPKFTQGDLVRKALQLRQQHTLNAPVPPAGPRGPKPTIVEFKVTLSDGTVLHATGKHADVMVRFSNECQEICQTQGLAAYNGPPLTHYTAEEWAAKNS
jgi:hypothetical protein